MQRKDTPTFTSVQEILDISDSKVTIGSRLYESVLFCADPADFRQRRRKSVCSAKYSEIYSLRKSAKKKLANAITEYNRILHGREPEKLKEIHHLQNSIKSLTQKIATQRSKLEKNSIISNEIVDAQKAGCCESGKTKSKPARDFETIKKNACQLIAEFSRDRRAAKKELRALQRTQEELLAQKSEEISCLRDIISQYDSRLAALVTEDLIQYVRQRDAIIKLVQADLDITPDTQKKIIKLVPNYAKSEWHLSLNPLGTSFSLISMEIKRNKNQTMAELIASVAESRGISFIDAMVVLSALRKRGLLFYIGQHHSDRSLELKRWSPVSAKQNADHDKKSTYCHNSGDWASAAKA